MFFASKRVLPRVHGACEIPYCGEEIFQREGGSRVKHPYYTIDVLEYEDEKRSMERYGAYLDSLNAVNHVRDAVEDTKRSALLVHHIARQVCVLLSNRKGGFASSSGVKAIAYNVLHQYEQCASMSVFTPTNQHLNTDLATALKALQGKQ